MIPSAVTPLETACLVRYARGRDVLEVGSLLGYSTIALASVARSVTAVDPHEGYPVAAPRPTLPAFMRNIEESGYRSRITPVVARDDVLERFAPAYFGMAFIDATGEYEDTLRIANRVWPLMLPGATIGIHDCGHPDWPGAMDAASQLARERRIGYDLIDRLALFQLPREV